ncbi:hypothetical protein [Cupriavidus oxalaticus]|uniref:Uncharacterized protein n=1 Tax=Cupriavidus oxalaticus TaxID=96344 RepID=A0A4P7LU82_9BURK|nr:hypothetical protein [Cupriavidus oxalaticus]QBY56177.1 hypothetical protein E0W60_34530 [Cupriavidus oxalaticus]
MKDLLAMLLGLFLALPFQANAQMQVTADRNLQICLTGKYPSLCNHDLLTSEQRIDVHQAELAANFHRCQQGKFPSLCRHDLLTPEQSKNVADAEHRANLQVCMKGRYPSLCRRELLSAEERKAVAEAEHRANFQTCIAGKYPALCRHQDLTVEEAQAVRAAEHRENQRICARYGNSSLCRKEWLAEDADMRAGSQQQGAADTTANVLPRVQPGTAPLVQKEATPTGPSSAGAPQTSRAKRIPQSSPRCNLFWVGEIGPAGSYVRLSDYSKWNPVTNDDRARVAGWLRGQPLEKCIGRLTNKEAGQTISVQE